MAEPQIYTLTVSDSGLKISSATEQSSQADTEAPKADDVHLPRWSHWNQRKLARVWQATLLGMNIEPTVKARTALKQFHPDKYQTYRDRNDIAKTLIGWELEFYEDHLREGESAGEKYVSLTEYYYFAQDKGWGGLQPMHAGLTIENSPPTIKKNKENNYLFLLHEIFSAQIEGFGKGKHRSEDVKAVMHWLKEIKATSPISDQRMDDWIRDMRTVIEDREEKASKRSIKFK